jgi:hypothetical protein
MTGVMGNAGGKQPAKASNLARGREHLGPGASISCRPAVQVNSNAARATACRPYRSPKGVTARLFFRSHFRLHALAGCMACVSRPRKRSVP